MSVLNTTCKSNGPHMTKVTSPCVDRCRLDIAGEVCVGCGRSLQEIAGWLSSTADEKRAIVDRAAQRLQAINGSRKTG